MRRDRCDRSFWKILMLIASTQTEQQPCVLAQNVQIKKLANLVSRFIRFKAINDIPKKAKPWRKMCMAKVGKPMTNYGMAVQRSNHWATTLFVRIYVSFNAIWRPVKIISTYDVLYYLKFGDYIVKRLLEQRSVHKTNQMTYRITFVMNTKVLHKCDKHRLSYAHTHLHVYLNNTLTI